MPSERVSRLYGAMVIALAEGLRLGRVSEIYFDRQSKRMVGLSYRSGIWGVDKEIYIGFEDVHKFSRDMIIVSGKAAAKELPPGMAPDGLRALKGYKITTHAGKHIGELSDFTINAEGKIEEILLPENRKLQIDIADVVLGPDLIMVPSGYEPSIRQMEPEPTDFITRIFGTAALSETVREGFEGVRTSMRNNINSERVIHTFKTSTQRARDTFMRTSQAIQQTIDQIMKKRETQTDTPKAESVVTPVNANTGAAAGHPDTVNELGPEAMPQGEFVEKPKKDGEPTG
ncbi:MAG: hypothetical protein C4519_12065 [Desulfobacteraceae bacterium]|nr:MAG: hypothetical protein C4519_12065 [Desulfobacteraceae bacterium]